MWYTKSMKTVLITGASGDIGREIVKNFAANGYYVLAIYNHVKVAPLKGIEFFKCNLADSDEIDEVIPQIIEKYEHIDCLVNCAGVAQYKQIQDVTGEDFDFVINSNLKSAVLVTKYVAKNMISNKCGRIINISSMWGKVGASVEALYSASKGALNTLTLSLAKELAPSGITVNAVCPGLIDTKMNSNLTEADKQALVDDTPLGRIGLPKDVANAVEFFASDKASFITGQLLSVDGGLNL